MTVFEIFLLAIGLSMDSFAVSVSGGATMKRFSLRRALNIALILAVFQAAMPVAGWAAGEHFKGLIESIDHWIAFGLLGLLGVKMIWESKREEKEKTSPCQCEGNDGRWGTRTLLCVGLATSIDALAVGVSFAFLSIRIALAAVIIFAITLLSSIAGIGVGIRFGPRLNRWAGIAGGVILIGIGTKILTEHLFFQGA